MSFPTLFFSFIQQIHTEHPNARALCPDLGKQQGTNDQVLAFKELTVYKALDESGAQEVLLE